MTTVTRIETIKRIIKYAGICDSLLLYDEKLSCEEMECPCAHDPDNLCGYNRIERIKRFKQYLKQEKINEILK